MAAERAPQDNLAALLVVEALDRVAARAVRQRVLKRALRQADLREVPATVEDLTFFVSGPLYEQAAATLGADFADELLLEMSAALDRAWDHDRAQLAQQTPEAQAVTTLPPTSDIRERHTKQSTIRRARSLNPGDSVLPTSDTEPAPAAAPSEPPRVPSSDPATKSRAPGSRRFTMPYLQAVFAPPAPTRRLMIIDGDDDTRRSLAAHFASHGYAVAAAQSPDVAQALYARLRPSVVVADVETIAPDFEPLRSAFDEIFGEDVPKVVLLADGEAREIPERVAYVIHRPWSEEALDAAVDALLPLDPDPLADPNAD